MTNVLPTPSIMPSILAMVQRVKRECGLPVPTTLVGTTDQQAIVALMALNDGANDIWNRKRWEWKQCLTAIPLVAGTVQYALPADFERECIPPTAGGYPVKGLTQEEWQQVIPVSNSQAGSPIYYTMHNKILEIWPVPNADYVAAYPTLPFTYYRLPPAYLDGSDDSANISLPPIFQDALNSFAKWKTKEFLEYPDSGLDRGRYEQAVQILVNAHGSMRKAPRMRHGGVISPKIWS